MNLDAGLDLLMWCFPAKKDTLHKLITTSPSLREMPGIQYVVLLSVSGVYNLGGQQTIMSRHTRIWRCCYKMECFGLQLLDELGFSSVI